MKNALLLALMGLAGCARFTTTQTDERTNQKTGEVTKVTTRASSVTFFDSRSALSSFKATQTEKTQTATVGALTQDAAATNANKVVEAVIKAAIEAAVKVAAP